ncbi:CPI_1c_G0043240.mRNA.1.CDS.1 [Saccharomyces cerevisiae]|nr:CPI_1c_G0043240.mRNA.1.CDS.1 [Saccharomyces cerevisiae]CAI7435022.1 CPI_1c_G0043240.mRNA.1.CDS.1 [Saccharomyces cerevisiae]
MRMTALLVKMKHKMQFLSTIINEQESGANGWDEIAKKMNRYLFEKKVWNNEDFFYDGLDCEWFFSHFFLPRSICEEIYVAFTIECGTMAIH